MTTNEAIERLTDLAEAFEAATGGTPSPISEALRLAIAALQSQGEKP